MEEEGRPIETELLVMGLLSDSDDCSLRSLECAGHRIVSIVAGGGTHFMCLTDNGEVFVGGKGAGGQLGLGPDVKSCTFERVTALERETIVRIEARFAQSAAITKDGRLFMWGSGAQMSWTPKLVTALEGLHVSQCALGSVHCIAIAWEGENAGVYSWGNNRLGQLGLGHGKDCHTPSRITGLDCHDIVEVDCGFQHSTAVTASGDLLFWGTVVEEHYFSYHPTVLEAFQDVSVRSTSSGTHMIYVSKEGKGMLAWGAMHSKAVGPPVHLEAFSDVTVKQVASGSVHTAALIETDTGTAVYTWGSNSHLQVDASRPLDYNTAKPQLCTALSDALVAQVACGSRFTMFLAVDRSSLPQAPPTTTHASHDELVAKGLREHTFEKTTLNFPVRCIYCNKFVPVWSSKKRKTMKCNACGCMAHERCTERAIPDCEGPRDTFWSLGGSEKAEVDDEHRQVEQEVLQRWSRAQADFASDFAHSMDSEDGDSLSGSGGRRAIANVSSDMEETRQQQMQYLRKKIDAYKGRIVELEVELKQLEKGPRTRAVSERSEAAKESHTHGRPSHGNSSQSSSSSGHTLSTSSALSGISSECDASEPSRALSEMAPRARRSPGVVSSLVIEKSWSIDPSQVQIHRQLGEGASAQVFKGTYRGQEVAVKVMKQRLSDKQLLDFEFEFDIMRDMKSKYNVYFFGACLNPNLSLVMEYCEQGSLFLRLNDLSQRFRWSRLLRVALDVCKGVHNLHSWEPQVVHRDLKSHNLLVDANWNVKIADFGLARLYTMGSQEGTLSKLRGTYSYCAPEIYYGSAFTPKSDIFSIGVILWEMVTRIVKGKYVRPYSEFPELQFDFQVIVQTARGKRCTIPPATPLPMRELISACWHSDPERRPTAAELITRLSLILEFYREHKGDWAAVTSACASYDAQG